MPPDQLRDDDPLADSIELRDSLEHAYAASLPARHDAAIRRGLAAHRAQSRGRAGRHFPALLLAAALVVGAGVAFAAGSIVNLGKPANYQSTNSYFPLSGFHRIGSTIRSGGKPALLFIGVSGIDPHASVERWPLVKALEQFGTLQGARALTPRCFLFQRGITTVPVCSAATFDLSHATYRSRYLRFVSRDVANFDGKRITPGQRLSSWEEALWRRYACASSPLPCPSPGRSATEPLVAVGDYLQTTSQTMFFVDFAQPWPGSGTQVNEEPLPFDTVRRALVSGKDPPYGNRLVENVNAEANIMTALICHADGRRPASVCGRAAIKAILAHVR